jgi:hypothetical protein
MVAVVVSVHAEAIDLHRVPHLTTPQGDDCPRPHNDLTCQICRTLPDTAEPLTTPVRVAHAMVVHMTALTTASRIPSATEVFSPIRPRAPPAA